jgi:hypothetical protein
MFDLSALLQRLLMGEKLGQSRGLLSRAERWSREHFFSGVVNISNSVELA